MILETKRLLLREMKRDDYDALHEVLADPENMRHYPYSFDEEKIRGWIEQNITRYGKYGFGLSAVCLKNTGKMIGDCGLTLQCIEGEMLPEIGYHIRRDCQRNGYAKEAAMAVRDWAFQNTVYPALYSYCKSTNEASIRTAEAIGMRFDREYPDKDNGITHVSVIYQRDMIMNDYIAYCGLDCEKCEARLASVNDDNELRIKVSKKWSELNGVEITPEMINCSGCRIPGVKTVDCDSLCPIRQCAREKQMETCGSCPEMESCEKVGAITGNNPDARGRLENAGSE